MKYNARNKPMVCLMTNSTNYIYGNKMVIRGILIHSTGVNNPELRRYVQPTDENDMMMEILGKNQYGNDWNHIYLEAGVNAWIGLDATKIIRSVQTLPWDYMPWGCGKGNKGSCNDGWIQIEVCEAALNNKAYFDIAYQEACELVAYLCQLYNIDPLGQVSYYGNQLPTILSHFGAYNLGMGSGHVDIDHWFDIYNKSIEGFRKDVYNLLNPIEEEEDDMTQERFNELMNGYLKQLAEKPPSSWSEAERTWAASVGLIKGDETGKFMYKKFVTREECAVMLSRLYTLITKKVKKV